MERRSRTKKGAARPAPTTTKTKPKATKTKPKATTTKVAAKKSAAARIPKPATARTPKAVRPAAPKSAALTPSRPARRVIFIDVENTSSEVTLLRVLDHLHVDRKVQPTEVIAIGNWKSVGTKVARTLAGLGAQLIHSAPAPGVRDWSDLWIAVTAGRWLAHASPGDQLDLVSDDRAFDAVHDAAASLGVLCNRVSYRHLPGAAASPPATAAATEERAPRPHRRGGRGRSRGPVTAHRPAQTSAAPARATVAPISTEHAEAQAASQEQIRSNLARLTGGDSTRWINLDLLANALKAEGFSRPPGSPRLITRVRSIKGVELNANGMVRLVGAGTAESNAESNAEPSAVADAAPAPPAARRPRRRGGRRHRRHPVGETAGAPTASTESEPPEDELPF